MIRHFIAVLTVIFIFILVETQLLDSIFFLPVVPDLVLMAVLYFSINNGSASGELSGFFSGLILDFLTLSPLGLNSMLYTILGFTAGKLYGILMPDKFIVPLLLGCGATVGKAFIFILLNFFYPIDIPVSYFFSSFFLFEILLNTFLSPFIFKLLSVFRFFTAKTAER